MASTSQFLWPLLRSTLTTVTRHPSALARCQLGPFPAVLQQVRHASNLPFNTGIVFVPQQEAWVVERMGRFLKVLPPGFTLLVPFIDRIRYVQSLKEIAIEIPSQSAITIDNVALHIDGVLYLRIDDPYKASYGVEDPEFAITQLAQTTMRSEVGKIQLDSVFRERESLNEQIVAALNKAATPWGITCLRYEIREMQMPERIREAMQMQVEAERTKRAKILESEGIRDAAVNVASGQRQATILASEAKRQQSINQAEGEAQATIAKAAARAKAIETVAKALQERQGNDAATLSVAEQYVQAFSKLAKETNTVIVPANPSDASGLVAQGPGLPPGRGNAAVLQQPQVLVRHHDDAPREHVMEVRVGAGPSEQSDPPPDEPQPAGANNSQAPQSQNQSVLAPSARSQDQLTPDSNNHLAAARAFDANMLNRYNDSSSSVEIDLWPVRVTRSPLMHARCTHTDWEACERQRLLELEEVRDERNLARADARRLAVQLTQMQTEKRLADGLKDSGAENCKLGDSSKLSLQNLTGDSDGDATAMAYLREREERTRLSKRVNDLESDLSMYRAKCHELEVAHANVLEEMSELRTSLESELECSRVSLATAKSEMSRLRSENTSLLAAVRAFTRRKCTPNLSSSSDSDEVGDDRSRHTD